MNNIINILNFIINLDASLLMPIIVILIALLMKMKLKDALISGITLSIAFTSIALIINFMFESISPVAIKFVENTHISLKILDVGFSPMVAIALYWKLSLLIFPIQIIINIVMIHFNLTNVLNIDIFNIWNKAFTASIIHTITNNYLLALLSAIIQIILELKISDKIQNRVESITNIKGTTITHSSIIQSILIFPINNILDKLKLFKKENMDIDYIKEKIGIFGNDALMGFIIGFLLSLFAKYTLIESLNIAIKVSTSLVLLPIMANFFIKALNPISDVAQNYMKNKYKNRNIYIGLDWPLLAGIQELWIVSILLIPITLIFAIIFSKLNLSFILPLPGLINIVVIVPCIIICNKNILKTFIISTILTPIYLIVSSYFAEPITKLAINANTLNLKTNQLISYYCLEAPFFRWTLSNLLQFKIIGFISAIIFLILLRYFYKNFK